MTALAMDAREALEALDNAAAPLAIRRHVAADLVAALIDYLDDTEADADLEPAGDELDASLPEGAIYYHDAFNSAEDAEDDGLGEPSLRASEASVPYCAVFGWVEARPRWTTAEDFAASRTRHADVWYAPGTSQLDWGSGAADDREDEHDGSEPDVDAEHSLGWTDGESRVGCIFADGGGDDAEPSLGWTAAEAAYGRYGREPADDREHDDAERESSLGGNAVRLPDGTVVDDPEGDSSDFELSLGWSTPDADTVQGLGYTGYVTDGWRGARSASFSEMT